MRRVVLSLNDHGATASALAQPQCFALLLLGQMEQLMQCKILGKRASFCSTVLQDPVQVVPSEWRGSLWHLAGSVCCPYCPERNWQ